MKFTSKRILFATLLMGIATATSGGAYLSPVHAAAALKITNKALGDAVNGAQADAKAGHYKEALEKARTADGIAGKPAQLVPIIHQMIVSYAIQAKDYGAALAQLDKNMAAGEGDKNANLKQALSISVQMGNKPKVAEYAKELGGNLDPETRLYIAGNLESAGQYKEALAEAQPLLQGAMPPEKALQLQQAIYFKMNDAAGRRAALEQLVQNYPKPEYWHDLLTLAHNQKGMTDEQTMDILRLRFLLGDLKTETDFQEMAQEALVAGYPAEAKTVLDKATALKLLSGDRDARLLKMTNDRVAQDPANQAELKKKAASDANASVKLGLVYWTYGKNQEAEAAIRAGMKGKLDDPDAAKIALGHVLLSEGKNKDAVAAFNSVDKNGKQAAIARLWSIYARKA
jgi:tetratricopeptide (TPR) repeat protein